MNWIYVNKNSFPFVCVLSSFSSSSSPSACRRHQKKFTNLFEKIIFLSSYFSYVPPLCVCVFFRSLFHCFARRTQFRFVTAQLKRYDFYGTSFYARNNFSYFFRQSVLCLHCFVFFACTDAIFYVRFSCHRMHSTHNRITFSWYALTPFRHICLDCLLPCRQSRWLWSSSSPPTSLSSFDYSIHVPIVPFARFAFRISHFFHFRFHCQSIFNRKNASYNLLAAFKFTRLFFSSSASRELNERIKSNFVNGFFHSFFEYRRWHGHNSIFFFD